MRTRVKICGITRSEDAHSAAAAGADAIGLVFHPASPRAVTDEQAAQIVRQLPPFVTVVGLFVDLPAEGVRRILAAVALDQLQFHGGEDAAFCRSFARPYLKALTVREGVSIAALASEYGDAAGLLLDSYHPQLRGGSGVAFDWDLIPRDLPRPLILAGGLDEHNVADAVRQVRPWAVDVSSGVEREKGIKERERIERFVAAATRNA